MSDFVINGDMFGRYVKIPTDYSRAMHVYKVIGTFNSNTYCDPPILITSMDAVHKEIVPCLNVIHCGIDETKVVRVAVKDCEIIPPTVYAVPVVRCKDCVYFEIDKENAELDNWYHFCQNLSCGVKKMDYCSFGERRVDNRKTN